MSILFEPQKIRNLEIQNRFVRSATFEGMANFEGRPLPELEDLYFKLAESGIGLIVSAAAFVDRYRGLPDLPGLPFALAMDDDSHIDNWRPIVEAVHRRGPCIAMQIVHPGRLDVARLRGGPALVPSDVPIEGQDVDLRVMTIDDIDQTIDKFAQSCRRVKEAGFDAVQLHGGHGYMISNFISPYTNRRTDEYGGCTENRARFITEIVERARRFVGDDYPIMIKMNCDDYVASGLDKEEAARIAKLIAEAGMDCIEVTGGIGFESRHQLKTKGINSEEKEAYFKPQAIALKNAVQIPIILVGGMRSPSVMEKAIEEGAADFISMSRPFIREPKLINRWKQGDRTKATCISCSKCADNVFKKPLVCYVEEKLKEKRTDTH
jgi:2,4-dienoyl-CoA reductase-like NADH-dependent reductase (Old Yellow Enzyme family)